jgi:hypothetical protein
LSAVVRRVLFALLAGMSSDLEWVICGTWTVPVISTAVVWVGASGRDWMSDRGSEVSREGYQRCQQCAEGLVCATAGSHPIWNGCSVALGRYSDQRGGVWVGACGRDWCRIEGRRSPGRGTSVVSSSAEGLVCATGWFSSDLDWVFCGTSTVPVISAA